MNSASNFGQPADNIGFPRREFDREGNRTNDEKGEFLFQKVLGDIPQGFFNDQKIESLYNELRPKGIGKQEALAKLHLIFARAEDSPFSFEDEHVFPSDKLLAEPDAEAKEAKEEGPLPYHKPLFGLKSTQDAIMACHQEPGLILPTVVIFANETYIGGQDEWPRMAAQEEIIFLHSNIRKRKPYNHHNKKYGYNCYTTAEEHQYYEGEGYADKQRGFNYFGGAYVLKHNKLFFYNGEILAEGNQPEFNALFIAAPNFRLNYVENYYKKKNGPSLYIQDMAKRFDAQYELAIKAHEGNGKPRLIAGALGCGDFRNNPYVIAYLQILILQKSGYRDNLQVEFALLPPWDYKGNLKRYKNNNNPTQKNAYVFNFVIENFVALSEMSSFKAIREMVEGRNNQDFKSLSDLENQCEKEAKSYKKKLSPELIQEAHTKMTEVINTLDTLWKSGKVSGQTKAHIERELSHLKESTDEFNYVEEKQIKQFEKNIKNLPMPKTLQAALAVFLIALTALVGAVAFPLAAPTVGVAAGIATTEGVGLFAVVKSYLHLHAITKHQQGIEETELKKQLDDFKNTFSLKNKD
ncbi:MAG: hypothetical protein K0R24_1506 [Gammaproteobacteria bacterium]|jgi:hypothetical protein|nr:hypothetical protein [Gammaproteobacteria bacterium]